MKHEPWQCNRSGRSRRRQMGEKTSIDTLAENPLVRNILSLTATAERMENPKTAPWRGDARSLEQISKIPDIRLDSLRLQQRSQGTSTIAALEAGKAVMCEKPMATTLGRMPKRWSKRRKGQKGFFRSASNWLLLPLHESKGMDRSRTPLRTGCGTRICMYSSSAWGADDVWRRVASRTSGGMFGEKLSHWTTICYALVDRATRSGSFHANYPGPNVNSLL